MRSFANSAITLRPSHRAQLSELTDPAGGILLMPLDMKFSPSDSGGGKRSNYDDGPWYGSKARRMTSCQYNGASLLTHYPTYSNMLFSHRPVLEAQIGFVWKHFAGGKGGSARTQVTLDGRDRHSHPQIHPFQGTVTAICRSRLHRWTVFRKEAHVLGRWSLADGAGQPRADNA